MSGNEMNSSAPSGWGLSSWFGASFKTFGLVSIGLFCFHASADQTIQDDLVVKGSICVGTDCNTGENFNFDTIRMKENNLRIRFTDTSNASGFPTRDWQITANESANGGLNKFSIENIDGETIPFTIIDGARTDSLYISTLNRVGIGLSNPQMNLHIKTGNSPTVRLEQDGSSGFAARAWDVGGNETNFFIRDVENGASLPLRIAAGATSASIFVAADGDIGFETTTPDGMLDIAHPTDANNHAVLVAPNANFGINIDNGFVPRGLFDVQTTGGVSRFMVQTDGKVGVGLGASAVANGLFDVQLSGSSEFLVDNDGDIGIGINNPTNRIHLMNKAGTELLFAVSDSGTATLNHTPGVTTFLGLAPELIIKSPASEAHALVAIDNSNANTTSNLVFSANGTLSWLISARNQFVDGSQTTQQDRLSFYNRSQTEIMSLHDNGSIFLGNGGSGNNTTANHDIDTKSGAFLTSGGAWTNASSRDYKSRIKELGLTEAVKALEELIPITYYYNAEPEEQYVGFIAEDVPELVSVADRKGLSAMDIVAVLTKVVKEQQQQIEHLEKRFSELEH